MLFRHLYKCFSVKSSSQSFTGFPGHFGTSIGFTKSFIFGRSFFFEILVWSAASVPSIIKNFVIFSASGYFSTDFLTCSYQSHLLPNCMFSGMWSQITPNLILIMLHLLNLFTSSRLFSSFLTGFLN